jgi:hypothetical protein
MDTLTTETNKTETKKPKVSKKTKKSDQITEKTTEIINESSSKIEEDIKKETLTEPVITVQAEEVNEQNDDDENQETLDPEEVYSMDELLQNYDLFLKPLEFISKQNLKNYDVTKDSITQINKVINKAIKLFANIQISNNDFLTKETASSLKTKDAKAKKPKKIVNKENFAINKENETYKEILSFMKLPENTNVSKAHILQEINAFIKKEKTANNQEIFFEGDNRRFNLIGDLKVLFEFIKKQMIKRGDLGNSDEFPKDLAYTQIMKYLKYCFPETVKDKK